MDTSDFEDDSGDLTPDTSLIPSGDDSGGTSATDPISGLGSDIENSISSFGSSLLGSIGSDLTGAPSTAAAATTAAPVSSTTILLVAAALVGAVLLIA